MSYLLNSARVLIVDDDERHLASIRRILHGLFTITTTKDPVQALKAIEHQGPFAVVISDYRMPILNGIELLSQIRTIDKNVQRIMLTGHAGLQMAIDAVNYGKITAFLTKPASAISLRSAVTDAVHTYFQQINSRLQETDSTDKPLIPTPKSTSLNTPLTTKEKEVLIFLARGLSNEEIATELCITIGTVKTHVNNLFSKLAVNSRTKLVAIGVELGLIKL